MQLNKITASFLKGDNRTLNAKKNILVSLFLRIASVLATFLIIPITINYLDSSRYGIWLTLSSIVAWMSYFDLGLAHGFRNKFAEANAAGKTKLARIYVSTTYASIALILLLLLAVLFVLKPLIDWGLVLNVDEVYNKDISNAFAITISFIAIQMVLKVINTLLLADQKTGYSSLIETVCQVASLAVVFFLTRYTDGSLTSLAFFLGSTPVVVTLIFSVLFFTNRYRQYRPSLRYINFKYSRGIIGLGSKFFIIQISWILMFQCTNIVIARTIGPESVTIYNVLFKYFNVVNMGISILLAPIWSAFTEAFVKEDYNWMTRTYESLNRIWFLFLGLILLLVVFSPYIFQMWIGNSVKISMHQSFLMGLYMVCLSRANIYIALISGIGKVYVQTGVSLILACISVPMLVFSSTQFGLTGVLLGSCLVPIAQSFIFHIQLNRILGRNASAIWNK